MREGMLPSATVLTESRLVCRWPEHLFGYGSYTGADTLQGETSEPLMGRGTESA